QGAPRLLSRHVQRRALVQNADEVRAKLTLDLHGFLGREEMPSSVAVGGEKRPFLTYFHGFKGLGKAALTFDFLGNGAMPEAENLVSARVRKNRLIPAHKLMEASQLFDELSAGLEHEVVGVGKENLGAVLRQRRRAEAFEGSLGGAKEKARRFK